LHPPPAFWCSSVETNELPYFCPFFGAFLIFLELPCLPFFAKLAFFSPPNRPPLPLRISGRSVGLFFFPWGTIELFRAFWEPLFPMWLWKAFFFSNVVPVFLEPLFCGLPPFPPGTLFLPTFSTDQLHQTSFLRYPSS